MHSYMAVLLLTMSMSAMAASFEYAGLSRATTAQDVARHYPNSTLSGNYVTVSPKDVRDHIYGIELFGKQLSYRLRISFGSPERRYPLCNSIVTTITTKYGKPADDSEFYEEAMLSRTIVWQLEHETVQLQCFKPNSNAHFNAEAITVSPLE